MVHNAPQLIRDRCIASSHSPEMLNPKCQEKNATTHIHLHTGIFPNLPNMIQSDPDTKTNASMFFSLSQRSGCRRGSDCSIDCSKSPTIWQFKGGGDNISQADRSGGAGAGDGGGQQVLLRTDWRNKPPAT